MKIRNLKIIHFYRQAVLFLLLVCFFIPVQSQNHVFPYGAKIAFISDVNRWVSVCEDCQDLKDPSIKLTINSDSLIKSRPIRDAIWTVEYQDGKYRFRSERNTYMSVCKGCKKEDANLTMVVANVTSNVDGRVPREALFDIRPIKNTPYYQLVSYEGKYLTRNYAASSMKKGSHTLMAYYGLPCRGSSRFKIIELQEQSHDLSMEHTELSEIGWLSTLTGKEHTKYLAKNISTKTVFVPKAQDLYRDNSIFGIRYFDNVYYLGHASNGKKSDSYISINEENSTLDLGGLEAKKQLKWNLIKLGTTKNLSGKKKSVFFIKSLFNDSYLKVEGEQLKPGVFEEASIFMFEKNTNGLSGKRSDLKLHYEILKVPGTTFTVLNPNTLPKTTFYWTQKIYLDKKFNYKGANWRIATLPEIQKIFKVLVNKRCYLDLDGQYYYVKESGTDFYIHPYYMGSVKSSRVVYTNYKDKNTRRKVLLIKE